MSKSNCRGEVEPCWVYSISTARILCKQCRCKSKTVTAWGAAAALEASHTPVRWPEAVEVKQIGRLQGWTQEAADKVAQEQSCTLQHQYIKLRTDCTSISSTVLYRQLRQHCTTLKQYLGLTRDKVRNALFAACQKDCSSPVLYISSRGACIKHVCEQVLPEQHRGQS